MINLNVMDCIEIKENRVISLKSGKNIFITDHIVSKIHNVKLNTLRQRSEKILKKLKEGKDYIILNKEDIKKNKIILRPCGISNISLDRTNKMYLYGLEAYLAILETINNNTIEYSTEILKLIFDQELEENIEKKDLPATINIEGELKIGEKTIPKIRGGFGADQMILSELQIAELHDKEVRHIRQAVKRIETKLNQWVDYIDLSWCHDCDAIFDMFGYTEKQLQAKHFYIFSERGYLKLVKHFNDDESWNVFEELLDKYFNLIVKEEVVPQNDRAEYLLKAIEGKTVEERTIGLQKYTELLTSDLQETIDAQNLIIDTIVSDSSLYAIGLVGRVLKTYNPKMFGKMKIFEMMRNSGILISSRSRDEHNTPTHTYAKYFEVKFKEIELSNGETKVVPKTYFTGKGLEWFLKRISKEGLIDKNKINEIKTKITVSEEELAA